MLPSDQYRMPLKLALNIKHVIRRKLSHVPFQTLVKSCSAVVYICIKKAVVIFWKILGTINVENVHAFYNYVAYLENDQLI